MNRLERLINVTRKERRQVVGIMSGTSVDGIDIALTEIEGFGRNAKATLRAFRTYSYPAGLRAKVFRLFNPKLAKIDDICNFDFVLGELFARAVLALLRDEKIDPAEVDLIGTAGQTIWHHPDPVHEDSIADWLEERIETRSTLAIGQSSVIAERTGIITVGDLRVRDVAAGGQGAPLIAYADWVLLRHETLGRCVQNIGGIGNVTYLAPSGSLGDVMAFDTGPGNMVIDALTEVETGGRLKYDKDGKLGARGKVHDEILASWMEDPYFQRKPPKTTGREHFGVQFARRAMTEAQGVPLQDLIATATALTAHSIADAYQRFLAPLGPVDEVILGGGGSLNPNIRSTLQKLLPHARVLTHEDFGIDSNAKEAIGIAVIANDALMGLDTNVPGATGGQPTVLGKISL